MFDWNLEFENTISLYTHTCTPVYLIQNGWHALYSIEKKDIFPWMHLSINQLHMYIISETCKELPTIMIFYGYFDILIFSHFHMYCEVLFFAQCCKYVAQYTYITEWAKKQKRREIEKWEEKSVKRSTD